MTGRVRLHARIAETMEAVYGADAESHAAELAHHYFQGAMLSKPEKMVHYSRLAGERALAVNAYEEALDHFQRALTIEEGRTMDQETADLLFGIGKARAATLHRHEIEEVLDGLRQAFNYYVDAGDVGRAIEVAEYRIPGANGRLTGVARILARALDLVPADSHEAGRLLAIYGLIVGLEDEPDYESAGELLGRALVIARRAGDTTLEITVLDRLGQVNYYHMRFAEGHRILLDAVKLASQSDNARVEVEVHFHTMATAHYLGDAQGSQVHALAMEAPAEALRDRWWLASSLWGNQTLAVFGGEWGLAREFTQRALGFWPMDPRHLASRSVLEYQLGDFGEGKRFLSQLMEAVRRIRPGPNLPNALQAVAIATIARITGADDDLEAAEESSRYILSSSSSTPFFIHWARVSAALIAIHRRDGTSAKEQYAALGPELDVKFVASGTFSIDRIRGLLAQTIGDLSLAATHFDDVIACCRSSPHRPELAWTCCDYAYVLIERNGDGDRSKAISLLDESLAISSSLGMDPLTERVVSGQERAAAQPARAPVFPDGLTRREIEVLLLVCGGKTNREIGETLFISVKTAGRHVSNILNKTNTANRAEAATYAAFHGLTDGPGFTDPDS